ncbi:MAG: nucleotide exchange factor GrpE [Candidatus Helarchaeota archaeon]
MSENNDDNIVDVDYVDDESGIGCETKDSNQNEILSQDHKIGIDLNEIDEVELEDIETEKIDPKEITISTSEYEDLRQQVEKEREKYDKLFERFQRVQADFENYKKYLDKQKAETIQYASGQLIGKLLNVLDNFERALDTVEEKNEDPFIKGLRSIYNDFYEILKKEGLKSIECGSKFDPFTQECLMTEERDDCEEDEIIEVLSKGYMFKDKILRPALVKVAKKKHELEGNIEKEIEKENEVNENKNKINLDSMVEGNKDNENNN